MPSSVPVVGACSCFGGQAWRSLAGRDGWVEVRLVLQPGWMEVGVVEASRLASLSAVATENLACSTELAIHGTRIHGKN